MRELTAEQKRLVDFACSVCGEEHKAKHGYYAVNCAFKEFDNEYCPYVLEALKPVKTEPQFDMTEVIRLLEARLRHLLQSDFIRSFDEVDFKTHEYKRDIKEADELTKPKITVDVNIYDKCEIHHNCTVEIWENSATGKVSVGWYKNKEVNNE